MSPATRPPLTTNHYAGTKDMPAHRRAILAAYADLADTEHPLASMTRREAQVRAYGTDKVGASSAASAVGWLTGHGLLRTVPGLRYRITDRGRLALDLGRALDTDDLDLDRPLGDEALPTKDA